MKDKKPLNVSEASIGTNPELMLWESEHWAAMLDIYPVVEGHSLILPKRPVEHVTGLRDDEIKSMGEAIRKVSGMLKKTYGPGLLMTMKCGEGAARTISHLHIHVMPRRRGDRLWDGGKSRIVLDRTSGFPRLEMDRDKLKSVAKRIRGVK